MLRKMKWLAGVQQKGVYRKHVLVMMALAAVIAWPLAAIAQPVPFWSNTVENDATSTVDGGEIINPPSAYVPGAIGNAFAGNGSVNALWDNADVESIFGAWDDSAGSTIDLYFSGHWSTQSNDSGFWSVVDRLDGNDGYYILSVRDKSLRMPYKNSQTGENNTNHLTGITLADDTTYRLTVRQKDSDFEVYLDGGAYSNASPVFTDNTWSQTVPFPEFNANPALSVAAGGRAMAVGTRAIFGGALQSGEWVDHINVYNGYHTPEQLNIPEPASVVLIALGLVPALLRRQRSRS